LKGLFLRLDLAVAGRRAEGWSRIAVGDRAAWRGAQRPWGARARWQAGADRGATCGCAGWLV